MTTIECPFCGEEYEDEFHMCRDTQDGDILRGDEYEDDD